MQLQLQPDHVWMGLPEPNPRRGRDTYRRSCRCRPMAFLSYEHMFSPAPTSKLAQRTLGALRVARSFLLLEDDYAVDWEVGQEERARVSHPHRAALRGGG